MKKYRQATTQAGSGSMILPAFAAALMLLAAPAHAGSVKFEFTDGSLTPTITGLPAGVTASNHVPPLLVCAKSAKQVIMAITTLINDCL